MMIMFFPFNDDNDDDKELFHLMLGPRNGNAFIFSGYVVWTQQREII